MRLLNQAAAVLFALLGIFMVVQAQSYQFFVPKLGTGPGFMPMITGVGIVILSGVVFVNTGRNEAKELPLGFIPDRSGLLRLGAILAALAIVVVVVGLVGFRATMFCFLLVVMAVLGERRLPLMLVIAIAGSIGAYWLFMDKLGVPLPDGMFGF